MKINLCNCFAINFIVIIVVIFSFFYIKMTKNIFDERKIIKYIKIPINSFYQVNSTQIKMNKFKKNEKNNFLNKNLEDHFLKIIVLLLDDETNYKTIKESKLIEINMEEIVNNLNFIKYTNLSEINYHSRYILNIPDNEEINFKEVDFLLKKYLNQKKEADFKMWYRYSSIKNESYFEELGNSYIFLINTKILYFNYLVYSREYSDNNIYFWDISLDDLMTNEDFTRSYEFNRTETIQIFNNFSLRYNVKNDDYITIDSTLRTIIRNNYESEMFNNTNLIPPEDYELIDKILDLKKTYKEFLEEEKFNKLDNLENNLGMEMIVNDAEYAKMLNSTSWEKIYDIGRNLTENKNESQKIDWKKFDENFNQQKIKYSEEETIVDDDYYLKFKQIAELENNYYVWKKRQIDNPVRRKKIKATITNANSDSLFNDIGKNLHDSLQLVYLAKIPEKYFFFF